MDVEIFIHGVPDGQDYYGISEEQTSLGLFYDNSKESVKFVVETKKQGNKVYAYYSYLRYKGMIGAGGRPGSYFGLTLRLDKYYQDALHIYNLLEIIFKRYIVGSLLTPSGDGYRYLVPSFAVKSSEIEKLHQILIQLIQTTCTPTKFLEIDLGFIHPITIVPTGNIADVTEESILSSVKKYSRVAISPDYESGVEKEYKKKIQELEGKSGGILVEKDKKISEKDNIITSLNKTVSSLQSEKSRLEQEVKNKEADIQRQKKEGSLVQLLAQIKDPVNNLADFYKVKTPQPAMPKYGKRNYMLGLLGCALSAVIFILCLIILFKSPKPSNDSKEVADLKKKVTELTTENTNLNTELDKLRNGNSTLVSSPTIIEHTSPNTTTLKIDVEGYTSGDLKAGQTYTIRVKNGNTKYTGTGKWTLTNAKYKKGKDTDAQITIEPDGKGQVKLKYKADDNNCICQERNFSVQSNTNATSLLKIIIDPDVEEVELNKEYTFSISGYTGNGTWGVDGFSIPPNNRSGQIKVTANGTGTVPNKAIISFLPDGWEKKDKIKNVYEYKK